MSGSQVRFYTIDDRHTRTNPFFFFHTHAKFPDVNLRDQLMKRRQRRSWHDAWDPSACVAHYRPCLLTEESIFFDSSEKRVDEFRSSGCRLQGTERSRLMWRRKKERERRGRLRRESGEEASGASVRLCEDERGHSHQKRILFWDPDDGKEAMLKFKVQLSI